MQTLTQSYNGLSFVLRLNWDRLMMGAALVAALYIAAFVAFSQVPNLAM